MSGHGPGGRRPARNRSPEAPGRPPVHLFGAGVACLNGAGEVLLVRRADDGHWDLPGGRVEPGEEVQAAARRELFEETGLQVGEVHLLGVFSGPDTRHTYPDGTTVDWVTVLYLCRNVEGTLQAGDDAAAAGWFSPAALPQPMAPVCVSYLRLLTPGGPL